jgi:hypothetical protein
MARFKRAGVIVGAVCLAGAVLLPHHGAVA